MRDGKEHQRRAQPLARSFSELEDASTRET